MIALEKECGQGDCRFRKLIYRSWHRGMREMDLILGPFADSCIYTLTDSELDAYEKLLDVADDELFLFLVGNNAASLPVVEKIRTFLLSKKNQDS